MTADPAPRTGPQSTAGAAWGNVIDRVLLSLREAGPATSIQVAHRLGLSQREVARCLNRLTSVTQRGADVGRRRAHISAWYRGEIAGRRVYLRAIYSAGHWPDAAKPPALSQAQRNRRRGQRQQKGQK